VRVTPKLAARTSYLACRTVTLTWKALTLGRVTPKLAARTSYLVCRTVTLTWKALTLGRVTPNWLLEHLTWVVEQ
jgi:hypothetical protein